MHQKFGGRPREHFGGGFGEKREMHEAVCAECGKECKVPFKPKEDRPVYCKDCYQNRKFR